MVGPLSRGRFMPVTAPVQVRVGLTSGGPPPPLYISYSSPLGRLPPHNSQHQTPPRLAALGVPPRHTARCARGVSGWQSPAAVLLPRPPTATAPPVSAASKQPSRAVFRPKMASKQPFRAVFRPPAASSAPPGPRSAASGPQWPPSASSCGPRARGRRPPRPSGGLTAARARYERPTAASLRPLPQSFYVPWNFP